MRWDTSRLVRATCLVAALIALQIVTPSGRSLAKCQLSKLVEIPVTMAGLRPTIVTQINGTDTTFIVDSGAWFNSLSPAKAAELKLPPDIHYSGVRQSGIGGTSTTRAWLARVDKWTIVGVDIPSVDFIVGGSEPGHGISGLLGQNFLRLGDVEYDLAHGVIRIWRPKDCEKSLLAYWSDTQPFSVMDIGWATPENPHTTGAALLNDSNIRVIFDTGAGTSFVSLRAAKRAGIKLDQPEVKTAGLIGGIGPQAVKTWTAPFASFKVGDEEIRNTRLRIGDFDLPIGEMLLGADFFLSHRVYVSNSQHKLYFTYNGGPVFNLTPLPVSTASKDAAQSGTAGPGDTQKETGELQDPDDTQKTGAVKEEDEPVDAAGFARRGTAFAARRDFQHAIADLRRACELDPNQPSYFYQRGRAYLQNSQPLLAAADFDQALKLKPDDVPSLLARADLRVAANDDAGAVADLDAAQRVVSKEADTHFFMGALYTQANQFAAAIAQYDLWIAAHREDVRRADAFMGRSWARTLLGQDLDKALSDANTALSFRPHDARFRGARALAEFRVGKTDKALADWSAVLAVEPKNAWARYGRGVARLRKGETLEGQADIAAAKALEPRVAEVGQKRGVVP